MENGNTEEFFKLGGREVKEVIKYLKFRNINLNSGKILDFGCGIGKLASGFAKYSKFYYGVDVLPIIC